MPKNRLVNYLALIGSLSIFITACSSSKLPDPQKQVSGFLPDYSILQPVSNESDERVKLFRYTDPNLNLKKYHAVIIDPVIIYGDQQLESGIMHDLKIALERNLRERIGDKFNVVTAAGPGVAHLSVAIAGAELTNEGFKPRNLIPVSAAIKLMSRAAGYDNKTVAVEIASKITDSQSHKLLGASVATVTSEKFRSSGNQSQELAELVNTWVNLTVKTAANYKGK